MRIENFDLNQDVLVVAEIGNNHEGSYTLAEEMIGLAARAGAGAVKFQTIVPEKLVSVTQKQRIEQLKKFQLSYDDFEKLSMVALKAGIIFLSTPFDIESARFLDSLVPAYKIASGDNNFFPMLEVIARMGKPIILSTGMTDYQQVITTEHYIEAIWKEVKINQELAVLHCVTSYPTLPSDANLAAINVLKTTGLTVGYSDHTIGIEAAVLSVALGARIVEKHFTIAKDYSDFRDHSLSADPHDLKELVKRVKEVNELMGTEQKKILDIELENYKNARRSIVANKGLPAGVVLSWEDLSWVRPGTGLAPGMENLIIGKRLRRTINPGEMINLTDVEPENI